MKYQALTVDDKSDLVETQMISIDTEQDARQAWEQLVAEKPAGSTIVAFMVHTTDEYDNPCLRQISMEGLAQ